MTRIDEILVTTTSNVEGRKVKKYLKPVSSHVVAGTNLFSDIFASYRDIFGGRARNYQRQLSSIYNEAIQNIKQATYELGGNGVLGMRVDLDELSGGGKSMFMITATGTAVVFDIEKDSSQPDSHEEKFEIIPTDRMQIFRKINNLSYLAENNQLEVDDSTWEFITKNKVHEVLDFIFKKFKTGFSQTLDNESKQKIFEDFNNYISSLSENHRTKFLYEKLMDTSNDAVYPQILKIIKELMAFDQNLIFKYLQSNDVNERDRALQTAVVRKPFYTKDDIEVFENLIQLIIVKFQKKGTYSMGKTSFVSKEKEIWVCSCGGKNDIDSEYCSKCNLDIYGFTKNQFNPEGVIKILNEKIEVIKMYTN